MAFLVWRAVNNKLSTDDRVARMGITLEPKCYCCTTSHARIDLEDVQHLFCEGDFAKSIWRYFAGPLGIGINENNLKMILLSWWNTNPLILSPTTSLKFSLKLFVGNFGNQDVVTQKQFNKINIGGTWRSICKASEANIQQMTSIPITWIKPPPLRVKLNSDGSCFNGQSGGGGVIRDQKGDFIFAYSIPLSNGTSNTAEAETLLYGLQWCASKGIEMAIGETDSLLLSKTVKREWKPP
ncbi:hypothetical protein KY285_024699 [Solanum tuberosum]|nr:hypothetical protein KY285_024699 [Solanum tuberosum]